ncbi:hypothetical protein Acr_00g0069460 [Actinidia rufa]|uniref:Uncharacterized protein n=1 Tax=Actinidia rufa TaxID=165716 RepID=A0A7J0DR67_9ERIC|nr:hypothetical protein Acr_00g0069460 [Actinidia rufa]
MGGRSDGFDRYRDWILDVDSMSYEVSTLLLPNFWILPLTFGVDTGADTSSFGIMRYGMDILDIVSEFQGVDTSKNSNQQSILLSLLGIRPWILEQRPAQTNKGKQLGRGRSKPLRRGDQTKAMTTDGVMGRVHGSRRDPRKDKRESRDGRIDRILVEIDQSKYFTSPKSEEETTLHLRSTDEYPDSGSGKLSGDSLARFHAERWTHFTSVKRVRLPDEGEIITSTCSGEVDFYEVVFPAGLRFPLHPTIRLILQFYNICPAQLVPNAWRSIACSMVLWRARNKKVLLGGYSSNVKGGRASSSSSPATNGRFLKGRLGRAPQEFRGRGEFQASRTAGDNLPSKEAPSSSSDVGESQNPHEQARRESPSQDDSIECLGSIRTELRRLLPHILDLTPFEVDGEKSSGSYTRPFFECSELESLVGILLKFEPTHWREAREDGECELGDSRSGEGGVIGEKRAGESITSSPSKKGKADDGSKGKGVDSGPEGKKKATSSSKASAAPTVAAARPGEGTSAHLGTVPGPPPSILGSPFVAERFAAGGDSPNRQGEGGQAHLGSNGDEAFLCVIGQALVLGSSLVVCSREAGEQASLQEGRVASMETEVARLQKLAADLEQQLAESRAREQQANNELAKMKSDRDSLTDKLDRLGVLVKELREALNKANESTVEEFKSSSEFVVAVEDSASKYFGEGFDFCKVQLRRHHPDLAIDLEGTVVDQDLLAEQDEAAEENEREKLGENKGVIKYFPKVVHYIRM